MCGRIVLLNRQLGGIWEDIHSPELLCIYYINFFNLLSNPLYISIVMTSTSIFESSFVYDLSLSHFYIGDSFRYMKSFLMQDARVRVFSVQTFMRDRWCPIYCLSQSIDEEQYWKKLESIDTMEKKLTLCLEWIESLTQQFYQSFQVYISQKDTTYKQSKSDERNEKDSNPDSPSSSESMLLMGVHCRLLVHTFIKCVWTNESGLSNSSTRSRVNTECQEDPSSSSSFLLQFFKWRYQHQRKVLRTYCLIENCIQLMGNASEYSILCASIQETVSGKMPPWYVENQVATIQVVNTHIFQDTQYMESTECQTLRLIEVMRHHFTYYYTSPVVDNVRSQEERKKQEERRAETSMILNDIVSNWNILMCQLMDLVTQSLIASQSPDTRRLPWNSVTKDQVTQMESWVATFNISEKDDDFLSTWKLNQLQHIFDLLSKFHEFKCIVDLLNDYHKMSVEAKCHLHENNRILKLEIDCLTKSNRGSSDPSSGVPFETTKKTETTEISEIIELIEPIELSDMNEEKDLKENS